MLLDWLVSGDKDASSSVLLFAPSTIVGMWVEQFYSNKRTLSLSQKTEQRQQIDESRTKPFQILFPVCIKVGMVPQLVG